MKPWNQIEHYAALDWARDHHDIVVVDRTGTIVADFRIAHTREGWDQLQRRLAAFPHLAIAIETNQGPAVEQLLAAGLPIYPINPLSAERYRERKRPSGVKTDRLDAWAMADALRVDGHGWRRLVPADPLVAELRQPCRDEVALIEQRTALIAQLRTALHSYYPAALEAFDKWTSPSSWEFAPRLLSELGDDRSRFPTAESLQCYAGTAPITYQSGQMHRTLMRRACNTRLRHAVQQWANLSVVRCSWAGAYYRKHRADGQSHACAVRCLGQRWVKILWRMWQSGTCYDPELHQRNQLKHGSWVLSFQSPTTPSAAPALKTA